MTQITRFGRDEKIARMAKRKGAYLLVDRNGRYCLQLCPEAREQRGKSRPGTINIDPHMILLGVTLDEVESYLKSHTGPHRTLGPAEVFQHARGDVS